jgi:homoserine kinase type II
MGTFSKLNPQEINSILRHYEFPKAKSFEATTEGTSNTNYKVTLENDEKILLKVCNDKTKEQLNNEQRILEILEKYQYAYSLNPYKTVLGHSIYEEEDYFGVIFPFVEAKPAKVSTHSCFEIGKALASLHCLEIQKEDLSVIRPHDLVGHGGISLYEYVNSAFCQEDFKKSFNRIFPRQLIDIPYDLFHAGIIHGDLYYDNALFKGDELITLIDFEQAGRGRFILDLGIAISGSCLEDDQSTVSKDYMKSFLRGYEEKRELPQLEKDYLHTAVLVGFYSIALWRVQRFLDKKLDEAKKFNYQELLMKAELFFERF